MHDGKIQPKWFNFSTLIKVFVKYKAIEFRAKFLSRGQKTLCIIIIFCNWGTSLAKMRLFWLFKQCDHIASCLFKKWKEKKNHLVICTICWCDKKSSLFSLLKFSIDPDRQQQGGFWNQWFLQSGWSSAQCTSTHASLHFEQIVKCRWSAVPRVSQSQLIVKWRDSNVFTEKTTTINSGDSKPQKWGLILETLSQ